jgi:hypothetical protein
MGPFKYDDLFLFVKCQGLGHPAGADGTSTCQAPLTTKRPTKRDYVAGDE